MLLLEQTRNLQSRVLLGLLVPMDGKRVEMVVGEDQLRQQQAHRQDGVEDTGEGHRMYHPCEVLVVDEADVEVISLTGTGTLGIGVSLPPDGIGTGTHRRIEVQGVDVVLRGRFRCRGQGHGRRHRGGEDRLHWLTVIIEVRKPKNFVLCCPCE